MKKKLILLNMTGEYTYMRKKRMYIDSDVRDNVTTLNVENGVSLVDHVESVVQNNDKLIVNRLKKQYFGDECSHKDIKKIAHNLVTELRV